VPIYPDKKSENDKKVPIYPDKKSENDDKVPIYSDKVSESDNKVPIYPDKVSESDDKVPISTDTDVIIAFLHENEKITNRQARELLKLSATRIKMIFRKLCDDDKVVAHGKNKGRYYTLK
jgi:predicted HTH transcriptional regulator